MSENHRIVEVRPGLFTEVLAERTMIEWDPIADSGSIMFHNSIFLRQGESDYLIRQSNVDRLQVTTGEMQARAASGTIPVEILQHAENLKAALKAIHDWKFNAQQNESVP